LAYFYLTRGMRKALRSNWEPHGPPPQHPPPRMGRARPRIVYGGMGVVVRNDTTPVTLATTGAHASTTTGATTTVPPNLSLRESGSTPRPSLMVQRNMRPHGHSTYQQLMEKPRLDGYSVLMLQGRPPVPDKEEDGVRPKFFLFFSFFLSSFYLCHKL
jgi:hypothetical protein